MNHAREIVIAGTESADPYILTQQAIIEKLDTKKFDSLYIISTGKAAYSMAKAAYEALPETKIKEGIVVSNNFGKQIANFRFIESTHPLPSAKSIRASQAIIEILNKARSKDLIVYLLSGGSSSMVELPEDNFSIEDIKYLTEKLLKAGFDIYELNSVRKRLSKVKGGKLKRYTSANVVVFVLSDVIGDDLSTIGSGPFFEGKNDPLHIIVGNNKTALTGAKTKAESLGYKTLIINEYLNGEAIFCGAALAQSAITFYKNLKNNAWCLLFGGETYVKVKGKGKGGRNQELALAFIKELKRWNVDFYFEFACIATDGIDGNSPAAGAAFNSQDIKNIDIKELDLALDNNDSYSFLKRLNLVIETGPTGTNVCDIGAIIIKGGN